MWYLRQAVRKYHKGADEKFASVLSPKRVQKAVQLKWLRHTSKMNLSMITSKKLAERFPDFTLGFNSSSVRIVCKGNKEGQVQLSCHWSYWSFGFDIFCELEN